MLRRYLGVDLAWSARARSGVCALDGDGRLLDEDALDRDELVAWLGRWRGGSSLVALDAPLLFGSAPVALRPVERALHRRYGGRHAGPFPGGALALAHRGRQRPPAEVLLDEVGPYSLDPFDFAAPHRAIEVFPAPAWIELFNLPAAIRYKRGPKSARIAGLSRLWGYLDSLVARDPALQIGELDRVAERSNAARTLGDWKAVEDILDARLCAYLALLWDRTRDPAWVVTGTDGDWRAGYIVVPS